MPRVLAGQLEANMYSFKYVRVQGTLQDVFADEIDARYAFGLFFVGERPFYIVFYGCSMADLRPLVGARLELACYVDRFVPPKGRHVSGIRLMVSRTDDAIRVLDPAPADPFDVPDLEASGDPRVRGLAGYGRSRVHGQVVARWGRLESLVRCREDGRLVKVSFQEGTAPSVGQTILAAGLPEYDYFRTSLVRAVWREEGEPTDAVPVEPAADFNRLLGPPDEIPPDSFGAHVRLMGRVLAIFDPEGHMRHLLVESGRRQVMVDVSALAVGDCGLQVGCEVEIVGRVIHEVSISNAAVPFAHVRGFFVVPESAANVRVTRHPPWWTAGRLLVVVLVLLAVVVAVLVWNRALGIVAERRGRELYRRRIEGARDAIKEIERKRLSVELHDSLAQTLAGVSMEIEAAQQFAEGADVQLVRHLSIAERVLDSSRRELKNCLWDLRSDAIGEPDMSAAVRKTLLPHCRNVTLDVRFNVSCSRLEANLAYDVLRIVRELSLNAIRHGGARHLEIAGCIDGGRLFFSVRDDGSGFDPDAAPGVLQGHFGIRGVRERLKGHGGTLDYERLDRGMYARVALSLAMREEEGEV